MHLLLGMILAASGSGFLAERPPAGVRLLDAGPVLFGASLGAVADDLTSLSRTELELERTRLLEDRRSLAPGIILTAVGGSVTLIGLTLMSAYLVLEGLIVVLVGLPPLGIGVALLVGALTSNARVNSRLRAIDREISAREFDDQGGGEQPPPPPPPPPGVWRDLPAVPRVLAATF